MPINSDKPHLWKKDIAKSVDMFNDWFVHFAPKAYRESRSQTTEEVAFALRITGNLSCIQPGILLKHPGILPALRMATCPPLARDRLIGLASVNKNLVLRMESNSLPPRMKADKLNESLEAICKVICNMLDRDIFPWLDKETSPRKTDRYRAATIVADRLCGAVSDPIIRNAQEKRQLLSIQAYLKKKGYRLQALSDNEPITEMKAGTFTFRKNLMVGDAHRSVRMPIDAVVQPKKPRRGRMPILIEAKSAGDYTNTNKRRKEEATKARQLRDRYGRKVRFVLFLCGYFDSGYLGYEAAEGIDWIWEHRIDDLDSLGI